MQIVPVLSKQMLLKRQSRLIHSAAKIAEETTLVRSRELVLVLIPLVLTAWSCAQMPQEEWSLIEVPEAGFTLEAVPDYCPVQLQGFVAPRCPGVAYVIGNEISVLVPLEQVCRLSVPLGSRTFLIVVRHLFNY